MPAVTAPIPQGDLALLATPVARELLESRIPARMAYTARDGFPRIVATWFYWNGVELVMPTFISAPHIVHPPRRVRDLRADPRCAISIDTEGQPPEVLTIRGEVAITEVAGVADEYALSARRYLGDEAADGYLAKLANPATRIARISCRPAWVGLLDFITRLPDALGGLTTTNPNRLETSS